jgi:purine-nucleoside phosphorylase
MEESMRRAGVEGARIAFVLGSGLGAFAERLSHARAIAFAEVDAMPTSRVPGHAGRLVVGEIDGVRVVVQQGRVHLYEGWSANEVSRSVRAFAHLGVRAIVLTNAAGGLHPEWRPGTFMLVRDHVNFQGATPLEPRETARGSSYDPELARAIARAADSERVTLESGVYAGVLGPSYETPAEIRMLRWMGADAVGMSTIAEAVAAHASGARVAAISCITNAAAGITESPLSHEEVIRAGREAAPRFCAVLQASVAAIAETVDRA